MQSSYQQQVLDGCDRCVLCGLCLPHCPTYQLEQNECESPRGRIVLIQALMRGDLEHNKSDLSALEHCLLCRSCEAVCPSKVPYGDMIALTRDILKPKQGRMVRQLMDSIAVPGQIQKMLSKTQLYQKSGLQKLVQSSGLLKGDFKAAEGLLKFGTTEKLKDYYPAKSDSLGDVQLFTGCMGESFDLQTVKDAIQIINRIGYGVKLDHPVSCCGAMHHHNGDVQLGKKLNLVTYKTLSNTTADTIVGLAGSCIARLNEGNRAEEKKPIIELTDFLAANIDAFSNSLSDHKKKVALHRPCTSKNLLKNFDKTIVLLNKVPGLEVLLLPTYGCCGASGTHMVSHPEHAGKFVADTIDWLEKEKPELILSQNMGCMFHITTEIERRKLAIDVIHPISLLRNALQDSI